MRHPGFVIAFLMPAALAACDGPQNWMNAAGEDAERAAGLFEAMMAGAAVVWLAVMSLAFIAYHFTVPPERRVRARQLVVWGGALAPTVVLSVLLVASLLVFRERAAREGETRLAAVGEQWWWRVTHLAPDGARVPAPNELRLPVGTTTRVELTATDVIHSFWAPTLAGKTDMIPGRVNRIDFTPTRTGAWRGQCAEYCGGAHAQMAFPVVVMEPDAYAAWVAHQARPAAPPADARAERGLELFLATGCGACHAIRGTPADGALGPDLTHIASRESLGAGVLPMTAEAMALWIARTDEVKPGVRMPAFGMLPDEEIALIAHYLMGLE